MQQKEKKKTATHKDADSNAVFATLTPPQCAYRPRLRLRPQRLLRFIERLDLDLDDGGSSRLRSKVHDAGGVFVLR